ncbi:MAG: hypothetical protein ACD_41C00362G0003 [uncultured bacterium]|nr:MAG: hypothetical protein ACD_41C00362G0003 [uncultured bacterium]
MSVVFVGRFQPLHNGHVSVIQQYTDLVIAIGSSQYSRSADNPLNFAERLWCLQQVTTAPIVAVPDIHDDAHWVEHLLNIVYTVTPTVDGVISGNAHVQRLCQAAGVTVIPIVPTLPIDATALRQLIRQHNPIWKQYVPTVIHQSIEPIIAQTPA